MRDYNFFESYQKKRNVSVDVKSPVFLGMIVIILIITVSIYLIAQNIILGARLISTTANLVAIQSSDEYQEAIKLQDSITAMSKFDQDAGTALDRIKEGSFLNTTFLTQMSKAIPATASIQSANITRSTAEMYFNVPNEKTAAELVGSLDQSGLFLNVTLVSVTKDQGTGSSVAVISGILKAGDNK